MATEESEILETPLTGGSRSNVVRRGGIVARESGSWAPSVHALLNHLEIAGFEGAPRVIGSGFDQKGREILTYVEGELIHPGPWADTSMSRLGTLMRQLHDATASFRVPDNAIWRPWFGREIGKPDIIGHCDAAPWNIIARNGEPFALVDWEVAKAVAKFNGTTAGNVLAGGVIGLGVDAASGANFYYETPIMVELTPAPVAENVPAAPNEPGM
jgi:hypothetical protein